MIRTSLWKIRKTWSCKFQIGLKKTTVADWKFQNKLQIHDICTLQFYESSVF